MLFGRNRTGWPGIPREAIRSGTQAVFDGRWVDRIGAESDGSPAGVRLNPRYAMDRLRPKMLDCGPCELERDI